MPKRRDPRHAIAKKLIKETGMPIYKAMMAAGYTKSTAMTQRRHSARKELQDAQDEYVREYMANLEVNGLDAKSVNETLGAIVKTGDNKDKIGAIGQHLKIILRRSDVIKDHSLNSGTINLTQNFIVPQKSPTEGWKSNAVSLSPQEISLSSHDDSSTVNEKVSLSPQEISLSSHDLESVKSSTPLERARSQDILKEKMRKMRSKKRAKFPKLKD